MHSGMPMGDGMNFENSSNGQKKDDMDRTTARRWTKYKPALKTLLPFRSQSAHPSVLPNSQSGLFSYVTMTWLSSLMWKALRNGLTREDLWELHDNDKAERNARRLNKIWEQEKLNMGDEASFSRCIWRFGKTRFILCIFLMIFTVFLQFLVPAWILNWILDYIQDENGPLEKGIALAALILVTQSLRTMTFVGIWLIGVATGVRVEGAMQYMTYEKLLRLRNGGDSILAKAITFCTNDQERIFECVAGGVLVIAAPVMFTMSIIYTTIVIGPWALVGNAVIFLFYPVMGGVAAGVAHIRRKTVKLTNARVGLMTEILSSIRLIKMYGWEDSFIDKISAQRELEEQQLRKAAFLQSMTVTLTPMINIAASVITFIFYTLSGHDLTAAQGWSIFSVFAAMQFTVGTLPFAVRSMAEAKVCFQNFQNFLKLPEYEMVTTDTIECDHDSVIVIKDGDFAWEHAHTLNTLKTTTVEPKAKKKRPNYNNGIAASEEDKKAETDALAATVPVVEEHCLSDINLEIKRGKLIGISGLTASGKTALLSAILGDVKKLKGDILLRGSLALVSQQAWIYNDTFQDNILFGSPMHKEKYDKVLEICCLKDDIAMLPDGDKTLIGDRGITLSGGQKQRLALGRSVYSDRSIYLLDDVFSAVDAVIGKEIFHKCVKEYLKDKTILLVTHGVEYLEHCDEVIFIKHGRVTERGKHSELIKLGQDYYHLAQNSTQQHSESIDSKAKIELESSLEEKGKFDKEQTREKFVTLSDDENVEYKDSGIKAFLQFVKAGGGYIVAMLVFFLLFLFGAARIFISVYLRYWMDQGDGQIETRKEEFQLKNASLSNETIIWNDHDWRGSVTDNPDLGMYQLVLCASLFISYVIGTFKGLATTRFVLKGASTLHNQMFAQIIRCPMSFFDKSPVGRITNRFSKDMDELDARIPFFFEFVSQALIFVSAMILVICFLFPMLSIAMLIIFAVMAFLGAWLMIGVRETKKLDNVLKGPVVGHLQSSMAGLTIIRTYNRQAVFQQRFSHHLNKHLAAEAVYRIANRWFTIRVDVIGLAAIFSTVLYGVLMRGNITPAAVGLAFSSIYLVCTFMPFFMRMLSELNARFTSVERIMEYGDLDIESEPAKPLETNETWPSSGEIVLKNVTMRYREDFPLVLQNISLHIKGGEKVGIVGRTGSGKSSLMSALLRLCDLESGDILIDGIDTSQVLRSTLRQGMAVIPQDPVLFQGTVRYNLDPFDKYSDDQLWDALRKSNLKDKISNLNVMVESEGDNFSVGEKQLICLSRAILRKNKILLLDEATASVDMETDALIQTSIRTTFSNCTVLTIAHRLHTIASYDRVVVIDGGKVQEFDTPENLMANQTSVFYNMMKAAGISNLDQVVLPGPSSDTEKE